MTSSLYSIEPAKLDADWDAQLIGSDTASIFLCANFLQNINRPVGIFYVKRSNVVVAQIALVESDDGTRAILDDLVIYSGVSFCRPKPNQNRSQVNSERLEILTFAASALADRYLSIKFAMAPAAIDVRGFDWYNYGCDRNRYVISPRYTCVLHLSEFISGTCLDFEKLKFEMSSSRRQRVRQVEKLNLVTKEVQNIDIFSDFYIKTFEKQGIKVDQIEFDRMRHLLNSLMDSGVGHSFVSFNEKGVASSASFFGVHQSKAYYLFGASDPASRGNVAGTAAIWYAIKVLYDKGINVIDFEGVNSPNRGYFKLSFGTTLVPYFQIEGEFGPSCS